MFCLITAGISRQTRKRQEGIGGALTFVVGLKGVHALRQQRHDLRLVDGFRAYCFDDDGFQEHLLGSDLPRDHLDAALCPSSEFLGQLAA